MLYSALPAKFPIVWANGAAPPYIRTIPEASQIGIQAGAASLTDGFPPVTFSPVGAGGTPPFGADFNGILQQITAWNQWQQAGGAVKFDGTFSTAIGGYPAGAVVESANYAGLFWVSSVDNNTTNPDSSSSAGWMRANRLALASNTIFYVASTGSDVNGLGTSLSPWLTLQHAYNWCAANLDLNGFQLTISIADATYAAGLSAVGQITGQNSPILITGNVGSPDNVIFTSGISASQSQVLTISGLKMNTAGPSGFSTSGGGGINLSSVDLAGASLAHVFADIGGTFGIGGNITVSGGSAALLSAASAGTRIEVGGATITFTGSPAFSIAVLQASALGLIDWNGNSFSGTVTGSKYSATLNAVINSHAAGSLPGSTGGTTATGGQFA